MARNVAFTYSVISDREVNKSICLLLSFNLMTNKRANQILSRDIVIFFHIGLLRSGVWNARGRREYGQRCGISLHKKGRGSCPLTIEIKLGS